MYDISQKAQFKYWILAMLSYASQISASLFEGGIWLDSLMHTSSFAKPYKAFHLWFNKHTIRLNDQSLAEP